jgi:SAM-dependent methyltransferase
MSRFSKPKRTLPEWVAYWDEQATGIEDEREANGYAVPPEKYRERFLAPYLELLELEPEHAVLDVGCGTGLLLRELESRAGRVVGADASPAMLARYEGGAEVVIAPAHDLPFPPGSFDRISMINIAQYFPSTRYLEQVIRHLFGLLGEDGILVVGAMLVKPPSQRSPYPWIPRERLVRLAESFRCYFSILAPPSVYRDSSVHERADLVVYKGAPGV